MKILIRGICLVFVLSMILMLMGCGNKTKQIDEVNKGEDVVDTSKDPDSSNEVDGQEQEQVIGLGEGFPFQYQGVTLRMHASAKPILDALGDPMEYFEAPSCAFQGLDKFYYYQGIELSTYPFNGEDYIASIDFKDDTVTTLEGIYIGAEKEEMLEAYGDNYKEEFGLYTYTLENSSLSFIVEEDIVTAITYTALLDLQ